MTGTAILINEDHSVTVLENVEHEVYEELASQKDCKDAHCTINGKDVYFEPIRARSFGLKSLSTGITGISKEKII